VHPVVWNQELFLPTHEDGASVSIIDGQARTLCLVPDVAESREAGPMDDVLVFTGAPVLSEKAIATADDLCVKIGCELGPVICEATDAEIAAEKRGSKIDILEKGESGLGSEGENVRRW